MEPNDCATKDCSTIYRFQFASIAFLCAIYLPFTFHSNIWTLYTQPFTPVNCSVIKTPLISNQTTKSFLPLLIKNYNRSDCCPCDGFLRGNQSNKHLWKLCQEWMANVNELEARKATIIDEVKYNSLNIHIKSFYFI